MQESEGKMVILQMDPPVKAHKRCQSNRLWMEWTRCQKYFAQWLGRSAKLFSGLSVQCIFFNGVYDKTPVPTSLPRAWQPTRRKMAHVRHPSWAAVALGFDIDPLRREGTNACCLPAMD
jgi:hypothetical protein